MRTRLSLEYKDNLFLAGKAIYRGSVRLTLLYRGGITDYLEAARYEERGA